MLVYVVYELDYHRLSKPFSETRFTTGWLPPPGNLKTETHPIRPIGTIV